MGTTVKFYGSDGGGGLVYAGAKSLPFERWSALGFADLEGDGTDGLVLAESDRGTFFYYQDIGDASPAAQGYIPSHASGWNDIAGVDTDGDGQEEFVAMRAFGSDVATFRRDGSRLLPQVRRRLGYQYTPLGFGRWGTDAVTAYVMELPRQSPPRTPFLLSPNNDQDGGLLELIQWGLQLFIKSQPVRDVCVRVLGRIWGQNDYVGIPAQVILHERSDAEWWFDVIHTGEDGRGCVRAESNRSYEVQFDQTLGWRDEYDPYNTNCLSWEDGTWLDVPDDEGRVTLIRIQQEVEYQPSCEGSYYTVSGQVVGAIGYESYVEFVDTDTDDRGYPDRSPPGDYQFHEWAAIGSDGTFHLPYVPADIRVKARVGWQCAPVPWRCDYNPCSWVAVPDPVLDSYDGVAKSTGLNVSSSCEAGCAISNATPQCP